MGYADRMSVEKYWQTYAEIIKSCETLEQRLAYLDRLDSEGVFNWDGDYINLHDEITENWSDEEKEKDQAMQG